MQNHSSLPLELPLDEPDPVPHIREWSIDEQLKYCAARWAYRHQSEFTPIPVRDDSGKSHRETWQQWWERRYRMPLDVYAERHKK